MKKNVFHIMISVVLALSFALAMSGCGAEPASVPESVSRPDSSASAPEGDSEVKFDQLGQTKLLPPDSEYSSDDENVAVVMNNVLMAVGNGTTVVTGVNGTRENVIMVTVETSAGVSIEGEDTVQLNTEDNPSITLTAAVAVPSIFDHAEAGVTWSTSDPEIATVDANGVVTAVSAGVVQISAESNYQMTTTQIQNIMGKEITVTEAAIPGDVITVMVNNEFDPEEHASIIGTYTGSYDWKGFAEKASEENPIYTKENFKWIRSKVSLQLNEDGTFVQTVLNAQRADYPSKISKKREEDTYEQQMKKYGDGCYVYNAYDQDPAAEEFANEDEKTFAAITGMESKGMHNFSEHGSFMIIDGKLILYYGHVNGFTGEYESAEFKYCKVKDNDFVNEPYEPFTNLVEMSDKMTMVLEKAE